MVEDKSEIEVQFAPAPSYLFDYMTADIETAECVFDLIDNSIDAARSAIKVEESDVPSDYSGCKIELSLSSKSIIVEDNCSGMSEDNFSKRAFRAGFKSHHSFGIGHFGVGLKRAILKLGSSCQITTDDGNALLTLKFTRSDLDKANDLKLPATKRASTSTKFTKIEVQDVSADTKRDIDSIRWKETLVENIGRRYGLFIRKGLEIKVDGKQVGAFAPQPVENDYIPLHSESFRAHGVDVEIVAGVHEKYRFGKTAKGTIGADPNNLKVHKAIAADYGWYVVCNDRVIVLHDQGYKTGWTTNWHNEYSGFVGWLHFRSEDPSLLPWNTRKSDIRENSEIYSEILIKLQTIAQGYRNKTPLARRTGTGGGKSSKSSGKTSSKSKAPTAKDVLEGTATKSQLSSIDTVLPQNNAFASKKPRLAGLVHDCERLKITEYPYASAIILRVVFEAALRDFLQRQKRYTEMRNAILDNKLEPGQSISDKKRKNYSPLLGDMLVWCDHNSDVFPDAHARVCKLSCQKFSQHLKTLNGVVHEEGGIVDAGKVRIVRDEVLQGLLHLLGS
ncbi:ATP-binding protein [Alterisphingorhabdus coralli]|uniref:ATP-binding protein n=1 Tax=Alterisphingorhabdus coralli TaxID=3071408 RepID=A0AA97F646_9SPHN|nr:ATP-binding protein [Parasphingorhabdus sp. SCSIO 66989]WOE74653.1 ATP-binding protein [Parasphingorhabdus sp. SCSIO 66989]